MRDDEVRVKLSKPIIVELLSVVRDENLGNPKLANDTFPYKISCIFLNNLGERLCLYPLSEVINGDDQKLSL